MSGRTLRVAFADDEGPARALLREYLGALPDLEIVAECANGFEAVRAVAEHRPDVLLLDVQMPRLDGFDVLELIAGDVAVVFVTAYDQYALRAFEVHAVDYLLKPFPPERLATALERARVRLGDPPPVAPERLAADARPPGAPLERILVRDGDAIHVIPTASLDYVEARDDYVVLSCATGKHRKQVTLSSLEERLDPTRFVRIHRSFLLNVERLARLELYAKDSRIAILSDGTKLPVSRPGYDRLRQLL